MAGELCASSSQGREGPGAKEGGHKGRGRVARGSSSLRSRPRTLKARAAHTRPSRPPPLQRSVLGVPAFFRTCRLGDQVGTFSPPLHAREQSPALALCPQSVGGRRPKGPWPGEPTLKVSDYWGAATPRSCLFLMLLESPPKGFGHQASGIGIPGQPAPEGRPVVLQIDLVWLRERGGWLIQVVAVCDKINYS